MKVTNRTGRGRRSGQFLRLPAASSLAAAAGLIGLASSLVAHWHGQHFPSYGYLASELVWNAGTLVVLLVAVLHYEGRWPEPQTLGLRSNSAAVQIRLAFPYAWAIGLAVAGLILSTLVGGSATSGSSFGTVHKVTLGLALAELFLRYPLTAFVEETLFRGWMQPRLGPLGPIWSSLLWAGYHLEQWRTIPSLLLFGVVLGYLRWRLHSVRGTLAAHYVGDATFFVLTYL